MSLCSSIAAVLQWRTTTSKILSHRQKVPLPILSLFSPPHFLCFSFHFLTVVFLPPNCITANVAGIKPTPLVEEERATNPEPVKPPPGEFQSFDHFALFCVFGCDGFDPYVNDPRIRS
jgi:hypothetical protein